MEKPHDAKDPDAVLHFAQELDGASTGDSNSDSTLKNLEQPSNAASQQNPPAIAKQSPGKEQSGETRDESEVSEDDDPGLVARMTAKGALWGF
ncbi:hypothetical protein ACXR0O_23145 [Verrucomicrobiota bacterium sgz303538]